MIIHDNKCIFIHIPKTGGQSVEISLGLNIGEEFSQNKKWCDVSAMVGLNPVTGEYMQHFTMARILSETTGLESYKSFTFVRNPWDRVISDFKWYGGDRNGAVDLKDFIIHERVADKSHVTPQYKFIYDDAGTQLVDYIGRFENLQNDYNTICDKIGIPQQQLPHTNKTKHKRYTEYYDDETRQIVAEKYARDIECFGYKFGE